MDNTNLQFGSGGQLLGDLSALKAEMGAQGIDPSVLNRVGGNAPTAKPNMAPSQVPQAQAAQPPATSNAPKPTGLPAGNPEAQMIVRALGSRLTGLTKMGQ